MKKLLTVSIFLLLNVILLLGLLLMAAPSFSHHMAEGTVDEEIYTMIDAMVADTPHADLVFSNVPETGVSVLTITTETSKFMEDLIEDGIMSYMPMLDGNVTVVIEYNGGNGAAVMTVTQIAGD